MPLFNARFRKCLVLPLLLYGLHAVQALADTSNAFGNEAEKSAGQAETKQIENTDQLEPSWIDQAMDRLGNALESNPPGQQPVVQDKTVKIAEDSEQTESSWVDKTMDRLGNAFESNPPGHANDKSKNLANADQETSDEEKNAEEVNTAEYPSNHKDQDWVEKKINPYTEWLEGLVYPSIRWMERKVQGDDGEQQVEQQQLIIEGDSIPDDALSPLEASQLLTSIHSGRVLKITFTAPNQYSLKHLSHSGRVMTFLMNSRTGAIEQAGQGSSQSSSGDLQ